MSKNNKISNLEQKKPGQVKRNFFPVVLRKNSSALLRLVRLMRSLTQSQKRDFKKYVKFWSGKSGRQYLRLFDALSVYLKAGKDEALLTEYLLARKKFGHRSADLSRPTIYLYRKILESLRTTPEGPAHLFHLLALLQDILFLYHKNLSADCIPLIEEARTLARDLDKPALLLELLFLERRVRINEQLRQPDEYFSRQRLEEERLQQQLAFFNRCNALVYELTYHARSREPVPTSLEVEATLLREAIQTDTLPGLSPRGKIRLYSALAIYHDLKHTHSAGTEKGLIKMANLTQSLHYQELALEAYRDTPLFFEAEQTQYVASLETYLNRCLRLGEVEKAERYMAVLEREKDAFLLCRTVAYIRLQHFIKNDDFRRAREYLVKRDLESAIEKFKNRFPESRLLALRFTCGQVFFCLDDFNRAEDWFRQVADMRPDIRPDAVWLCRLLKEICLFELGTYKNESNPARPLVNYARALRRAGAVNDFNEKLLEAASLVFRNPRALTKAGLPGLLAELNAELERAPAHYLYGMVLAWLDARLNRSSVGQEIRKYNR